MLKKIMKSVDEFNNEEDGIEAVQVIMIVAIAAIVLIAVMTVGQEVLDWLKEKWKDLKGKDIS